MTARDSDSPAMQAHDHAACVRRALAEAGAAAAATGANFTPVRRRALEILLESHVALGAYDLLRRLDAEGFGAQPPVAYRALDFLVANGFAHRIERLNAFVACMRPGEGHAPAFMICRKCRAVAETEARPAQTALGRNARELGFEIERTVVEAEGLCPTCQTAPPR
ncbi:Fur family transcriptional regulator [Pikeienuella sp. HZG-20]|uniref:Fur family transcriptional regulator n=1 Tax=Paludibacillus litoralis TaxID=3133267 RepID=UPI0030EB4C08